jgi:hypothetical protein
MKIQVRLLELLKLGWACELDQLYINRSQKHIIWEKK